MLRDASHRQVIQKFSFIDSLSVSQLRKNYAEASLGKLNTDLAFTFQQRALDRHNRAIANKIEPDSSPESAAIVPVSESAATIDTNWYQTKDEYGLSLSEILNSTSDYIQPDTQKLSSKSHYLGKILFALACSYCLFVLWWLFGHYGSKAIVAISGGKQIVLPKSEVEFIGYMERSLTNLERRAIANQKEQKETVYVPVYTPAPAPAPAPQIANNIPRPVLPNTTSAIVPTKPDPSEPLAIPAPPPLTSPTPINSSSGNRETIASNIPAPVDHTLTGVIELGDDRSAALVKVRGKTRRVWGWRGDSC